MDKFKPTLRINDKSSSFVDSELKDIISEIDSTLNEKEKKEKSILFNLAKMEYVVHNDPDLSEFYMDMVEKNKELYGYHYNEAIMNIIFNVKILKSKKYIRMYKNAPIKKKKRRDKYGIEDLKTPQTKRREELEKEISANESTTASASGAYATPKGWTGSSKTVFRKPIYNGGIIIQESIDDISIHNKYISKLNKRKKNVDMVNENMGLNEHHLDNKEDRISFIINNVGDKYGDINTLNGFEDNVIEAIYLNTERDMGIDEINPEDIDDFDIDDIEESTLIDKTENSISSKIDTENSIKYRDGINQEKISMVGGIGESFHELKKFTDYLSEVAEKRHNSMIRLDRVHDENDKIFKREVNKVNDIEYSKKDITHIDNPKKLSQDIVDNVMKNTKGEPLKNVGNSSNENGDEVLKRNLTDDESELWDKMREGMHTIKYSTPPDEKFEKRMKRDMGDDLYKKRQLNVEYNKDIPMYNKDKQPVVGESVLCGVYKDMFDKKQFVVIEPEKVKLVSKVNEDYTKITIDGLGNFYDNKYSLNESLFNATRNIDFYINKNNNIVAIKKSTLNESKEVIKNKDKMMKLINFNSNKELDSLISKAAIS